MGWLLRNTWKHEQYGCGSIRNLNIIYNLMLMSSWGFGISGWGWGVAELELVPVWLVLVLEAVLLVLNLVGVLDGSSCWSVELV